MAGRPPSAACDSYGARAGWLAAQPRDAVLAARLSGFTQIEEDAGRAVDAVARNERRPNQAKQPRVLLSAIRDWLQQPVVISARGHLENATHHLHAVPFSMRLDEFVGRADSPWVLVVGLRHRSSAKNRMITSVH
jgi:hypothetical protein